MAEPGTQWSKLWWDWFVTRSHLELDFDALHLGGYLLCVAKASPEPRWILTAAGKPMSSHALGRQARMPGTADAITKRMDVALQQLLDAGTLERREDGAVGFREAGWAFFQAGGRERAAATAERMDRMRERHSERNEGVTPSVTGASLEASQVRHSERNEGVTPLDQTRASDQRSEVRGQRSESEVRDQSPEIRGEKEEEDAEQIRAELPKTADSPPPAPGPPILEFPTAGRIRTWPLSSEQVARWSELYPGVDVLDVCRRALAWLEANPRKRKTPGGVASWIVSTWLSKEQDKARAPPAATSPALQREARNMAALAAFERRHSSD